jgi:hypothetical protein
VFENRALRNIFRHKRGEVTGEWRKRYNEEFYDPYSSLTHLATNRKVAGSIPYSVIGIFYLYNPSGRTMALGLTHPLTEMSTRNISWG